MFLIKAKVSFCGAKIVIILQLKKYFFYFFVF